MPTNYDGVPSAIGVESNMAVTGATNTSPTITITVSGSLPAEWANVTGAKPRAKIINVLGNTAANGEWDCTPTGASTFTIPVAGNGAYTSGGTVAPRNMTPLYTYPSDGDADNQASILAWAKATGDRSQYLNAQIGYARLVQAPILASFTDTGTSPPTPWAINSSQANSYQPMTTPAPGPLGWSISYIKSGDILDFYIETTLEVNNSAASALTCPVSLAVGYGPYGSSASTVLVTLSGAKFGTTPGSGVAFRMPVTLWTRVTPGAFSDGSTTGLAYLSLFAQAQGAAGATIKLVGDYVVRAVQWRPTNVLQ